MDTSRNRKPGRPRKEQTDQNILQAARELMLENGVQSFSMDALALRSGVSKPTIYRRWPTKEQLLTDLFGHVSTQMTIPDSGHALEDLRLLLTGMLDGIHQNFGTQPHSIRRFIAGIIDSEQLIAQYKKQFIAPRRLAYAEIIKRGIDRGEIRSDVHVDLLVDLIGGAYLYCLLFKPDTVASGDWLGEACQLLMQGIGIAKAAHE
ncbi:transcriptional regulator, TetR family [Paenibacillus curdlanolyticus YK9]|uniref:Transcriptional regulator, TetR family n=1 Tax=Paenibacillus curdlanolyticus YK9 TaxID=717606 RepID=E0I4P2_9BACL|nr:TetR/AcrR family transcriptional regulator [Paenibacillus curdlanolyticus]EFM12573.1 transcriptional regulator, TetR family [Paenibacillus curdlanolyticus YK9]